MVSHFEWRFKQTSFLSVSEEGGGSKNYQICVTSFLNAPLPGLRPWHLQHWTWSSTWELWEYVLVLGRRCTIPQRNRACWCLSLFHSLNLKSDFRFLFDFYYKKSWKHCWKYKTERIEKVPVVISVVWWRRNTQAVLQ